MKKNQKKNTQPLSKKQRKKLEKSGVVIKTRAPREKMPREKKWLISLSTLLVVIGGLWLGNLFAWAGDSSPLSFFNKAKVEVVETAGAVDTEVVVNDSVK